MRCMCIRTCQIKTDRAPHPILIRQGDIVEFDKCPKLHFTPVDTIEVDFSTASAELLEENDMWEEKDLREYAKEILHMDFHPKLKRENLIKRFIEARERQTASLSDMTKSSLITFPLED